MLPVVTLGVQGVEPPLVLGGYRNFTAESRMVPCVCDPPFQHSFRFIPTEI